MSSQYRACRSPAQPPVIPTPCRSSAATRSQRRRERSGSTGGAFSAPVPAGLSILSSIMKRMESRPLRRWIPIRAIVVLFVLVQACAAQIVYPWRAAPQIVRQSEDLTILYQEDAISDSYSVSLEGPYNRLRLDVVSSERGVFEYDSYTGAAASVRIRARVPSSTPEELYDLVVSGRAGTAVSKRSVKVVREFRGKHKIILISDPHISRQWEGSPEDGYAVELERFDNFVRVANVIHPDFVVVAGDLIHDYTRFDADEKGWGGVVRTQASEKPGVAEKWRSYFEGSRGYQGLYGLHSPAFSVAGNHDFYGVEQEQKAAQWNQYCGLRVYGASYGATRLLVMDNFLSGPPHPEDQIATLEAFLNEEGPGSLRILAQHHHARFPVEFLNRHNIQLAVVGHTHRPRIWRVEGTATQATSPGSVARSGSPDSEIGWFRIIWVDGDSYTLSPDLKYCSNSPSLPHAQQELNLTVDFERPNDGTAEANRATVQNHFNVDLPGSRVRFVMQKGDYRVSGGIIHQVIEGDAVSVLDVNVDLAGRSTAEIRVAGNGNPGK